MVNGTKNLEKVLDVLTKSGIQIEIRRQNYIS